MYSCINGTNGLISPTHFIQSPPPSSSSDFSFAPTREGLTANSSSQGRERERLQDPSSQPPLAPRIDLLLSARQRIRALPRDGRPPGSAADADMPSPFSSSAAAASSSPLSPADGFLRVKDGVDEMIKYLANEPSVGLYFVQQHARASMPILLDFKGKVVEKTHEVTLHTEDMEDSICAVRSMADFGLPLADDMIKDINKSLQIMSKAQPKRGLIQNPTWGFQSGKSSGTWDELGMTNGSSSRNYLSSMFNTAKQKASSLRWPQPDFTTKDDSSVNSASSAVPSQAGGQGASTPDTERDELPISGQLSDATTGTNQSLPATDISETYKKFKEEQELKLQEWLRESEEAEDNKDSVL